MRNIIITGGELFNKGAQAMTYIAVYELSRRYPKHRLYLLSEQDMERPAEEKSCFNFSFTGWYPIKFARCQQNALLRTVCLIRNRAELKEAEALYRNCDAMVDISGYALGSNWSDANCNRYLDHLEFAKAFGIPVYLMPQSFGPFAFGAERGAVEARIRTLLPTARVIFAREQEGYDALVNTYGLTNVRLAPDLVLSSRGIEPEKVFRVPPKRRLPEIAENSAAVVPNSMNAAASSQDAVVRIYKDVVEELLQLGKNVYLLCHSSMDTALCRTLKAHFAQREEVVLLEQEFSCLEFSELVGRFDFLVASRFHSIVHAYKNGVPCVALGWATKYRELLKQFGQEQYVFDVREKCGTAKLLDAIRRMERCRTEETARIRLGLTAVQKENVFDVLTQEQESLI